MTPRAGVYIHMHRAPRRRGLGPALCAECQVDELVLIFLSFRGAEEHEQLFNHVAYRRCLIEYEDPGHVVACRQMVG